MTKIAAIQMTSGLDVKENLTMAANYIKAAKAAGAAVVVLPECVALMGETDKSKLAHAESLGYGKIQQFFQQCAVDNEICLIAGTIPLKSPEIGKVYNACLVFDQDGNIKAAYEKLHLFDALVADGKQIYKESATTKAGDKIVVVDTPCGRVGLSVCYDLRFPELYRAMVARGAEIFVVPTAFTVPTGEAHWQVLTRARALENTCYLVAACQVGKHANGRETYGHSLIIDPWGKIVTMNENEPGFVIASIDLNYLYRIRRDFPVLEHRKVFL